MANLSDNFQPSFSLFPINNNRTGWQPVNLPLLLIAPYVRTQTGFPVNNGGVCELTFLIEEAPGQVPVAAPANIGRFVPTYDRFRLDIDALQLSSVKIDVTGRNFYDSDGNLITHDQAVDGDLMEYGMLRGPSGSFGNSGPGPIDTIPYISNADYYDLSPFVIETVNLPPGNYNFVYEARYYKRVISPEGEFVCIDDSQKILAKYGIYIKHPGEIHQAMVNNSPSLYFEGSTKDQDSTIAFYRPFADALQDIFDEQELLKGINFVDKIPSQYIPYLSYILGFDMPYFDPTTSNIRKALLRNGRKLQQLKGSSRAIKELFEIFGYVIDLTNLWYSKDGSRFIAPDESLPEEYADQTITTQDVCHAEPLLSEYSTSGFGQINTPLLFRPLGNMTVDGWLVTSGSEADISLQNAVNATATDLEAFTTDNCALTIQGFQSSTALQSAISSNGVLGHSTILVDQDLNGIDEVQSGSGQPLNINSIRYNKDDNVINVTFDRYVEFNSSKLYVFITYERTKINLPDDLANLRSNRFDIAVLLSKNPTPGVTVSSQNTFEFLLEFLFKFKAFHSLLRKISYALEINDLYNVTDFCVGGTHAQSPFKDAGQLQGVPPTIPDAIGSEGDIECSESGIKAGSKDSDVALRSEVLRLLEAEHAAWKDLTGEYDIPESVLPILQSLSRVPIRTGNSGNCEFTQFGQERVVDTEVEDFDHNADNRDQLCSLENNDLDYCYKGRVQQDVEIGRTLLLNEISRCKPCTLDGGIGTYYMTPLIENNELSGGDPGVNAANLTDVNNLRRSYHDGNYVRIMAFDNPQLHYNDRGYIEDLDDALNNRYFATHKPSLDVVKDNMFYPGHRFITMNKLKNDFTHPTYSLRPWDYLFDIVCPENLPDGVTWPDLNAHLEAGTDGDQYLVFDSFPLIYYGNGLEADIPVMNDHTQSPIAPNDITHSIWSSDNPGLSYMSTDGNYVRYVVEQETDGLRYPLEALGTYYDTICFTDLLGPIFESANRNCSCDDVDDALVGQSLEDILPEATGITGGTGTSLNVEGGVDYIDGYPADFGLYSVDLTEFDFPRERLEGYGFSIYGTGIYGLDVGPAAMGPALALGVPANEFNTVELQFKIGSGIRVLESDPEYDFYRPYRMDCGVSFYQCPEGTGGTGTGTNVTASTSTISINRDHTDFYLVNGKYDWSCDKLTVVPKMILSEQYGTKSCLMDGSIPNMMSFDDEKNIFDTILTAFEEAFPEQGNYQFIDDYGIIHIGYFETADDKLDITTQLKDPRVWGEPPTGEVRSYKVYRDGIITTERQIFQVSDFGYIVISEGSVQEVDRFQTTFGCGDNEVFEDPFAHHLDANVVDEVEFIVLTGTGTDITSTA